MDIISFFLKEFNLLYIIIFAIAIIAGISVIINIIDLILIRIKSKKVFKDIILKNKDQKARLNSKQLAEIRNELFKAYAYGIIGDPYGYDNHKNIKKDGKCRKFFKIYKFFCR